MTELFLDYYIIIIKQNQFSPSLILRVICYIVNQRYTL